VGKPAIYLRFSDKAALVAHVISRQLPLLEPPDLGDARAELWRAAQRGLPADGPSYVSLMTWWEILRERQAR
jgi:AcrR family transcriptional regulator